MTKQQQQVNALKSLLWLVIAALSEESYGQLYSDAEGIGKSVDELIDIIMEHKE